MTTFADYERSHFYQYIRPLVIKTKCEYCGTMANLECHHVTPFSKTLDSVLSKYALNSHDDILSVSSDIKKEITDIMLGKQIKGSYITVCSKCHDLIHHNIGFDNFSIRCRAGIRGVSVSDYIEFEIKGKAEITKRFSYYYKNNIPFVTPNEKDKLVKLINAYDVKEYSTRLSINKFLESKNIPYKIESYRSYYRENGKKIDVKNAWKIVTLEGEVNGSTQTQSNSHSC